MQLCLSNFKIIRPTHEISQEQTLEWIAKVHARGQSLKEGWNEEQLETIAFQKRIKEWLFRIGAGPRKVANRGTMLDDFKKDDWDEMDIYHLVKKAQGHGLTKRTAKFSQEVEKIFEGFYPPEEEIPEHLIHVTCTGYAAPSAAQRIVSLRKSKTTVTHAYHMGCYASIPAIRIGTSYFHSPYSSASKVDIVHTELCSLHVNPVLHDVGQIIVESLFADGFIKYSISQEKTTNGPYLRLLALHEEIQPGTLEHMRWDVEEWGFKMFITKDIPLLIANAMESFLEKLCEKAGISFASLRQRCFYAFHPGGPKILEQIAAVLKLDLSLLAPSFKVLQEYGNMSSATLPHIWEKFLKDPEIPDNTPVIGLAYGPGLTICGGLFIKCGS